MVAGGSEFDASPFIHAEAQHCAIQKPSAERGVQAVPRHQQFVGGAQGYSILKSMLWGRYDERHILSAAKFYIQSQRHGKAVGLAGQPAYDC